MRPELPEHMRYSADELPTTGYAGTTPQCRQQSPRDLPVYYRDGHSALGTRVVCYRPRGHKGDHVGHASSYQDENNFAMARWPNENEPRGARWEIVSEET